MRLAETDRAWPTSAADRPAVGTTARTWTRMRLSLLMPDWKKVTLPPGWKVKEEMMIHISRQHPEGQNVTRWLRTERRMDFISCFRAVVFLILPQSKGSHRELLEGETSLAVVQFPFLTKALKDLSFDFF